MKKILLAIMALLPYSSPAHKVGLPRAEIAIGANDTFQLTIHFDLIAWLAGADPRQLDESYREKLMELPVEDLRKLLDAAPDRFAKEWTFIPAGDYAIEFPSAPAVYQALRRDHVTSNLSVRVSGQLPTGHDGIVVAFPPLIGAVFLSVSAADRPARMLLLLPGVSRQIYAPPARENLDRAHAASRYLILGFEHILPKGLDHILFVLGLFLLSPKFKPLFWQVTSFTVAHSISLALSMYGIVSLPSRIVEPLIALSITFVALENIFTKELHFWRPLVVFGFGLVHGLGFASVLTELGLPRHDFVTALIAFNVGVELGQLSVIALAALAVGWFFRATWYRRRIAIPASCAIALVGLYWAVQRL